MDQKKLLLKMRFNSKILLFGEYSVLHGSDALLMPFSRFSGEFSFLNTIFERDLFALQSHTTIKNLYSYVQRSSLQNIIDSSKIELDINNGIYFDSNIPKGYGVGSSGALVAAFYQRYVLPIISSQNIEDIAALRQNLALLESYFHGKSSGLDPLVSFLNKPILLRDGTINAIEFGSTEIHPFLIDTGISRSTGTFVNVFNHKCSTPEYMELVNNELVKLNNLSLSFFLKGEPEKFLSSLKQLSIFQLNHLNEMILPNLETVWREGIESNIFYLKLCGAGGGGYILGFASDAKIVDILKQKHQLNIIGI